MVDRDKQQLRICIFISYMICFAAILSSLQVIFNVFLKSYVTFYSALMYIVYFLMLGAIVIHSSFKVPLSSFVIGFFILASYIITIFFHPENVEYMWTSADDFLSNPTYIFLFFSVIGFFLGRELYDYDLMPRVFEPFCCVTISLLAIRFFMGFIISSSVPEYMTFSYNLLIPTTFMLIMCIREQRWYRLLFSIVGTLLIFFAGCRGAIVCLFVSAALYVFFFGKIDRRKKYSLIFLSFMVILVAVFFWTPILSAISSRLEGVGFSSRTLSMLLESDFFDSSGREGIQARAWTVVNITGNGLWGDRVLIGNYPHNLFIELLVHYGWIIGILLSAMVLYLIINGLRRADENQSVMLCTLVAGFVKLLLSGSYLNQEPAFYILLGLCAGVIYMSKYCDEVVG